MSVPRNNERESLTFSAIGRPRDGWECAVFQETCCIVLFYFINCTALLISDS